MSDFAIRVEKLGKRYRLSHQAKGGDRKYTALRDVIAESVKAPFRGFRRSNSPNNEEGSRFPSTEDFWALRDVSIEIKQGESVGIIGRNGAGKSTLLKLLSRITEPTTGRIEIEGRVSSLLEVGTGFHQELTGRENIYLNGTILGMKRTEIRKKFDEIVAFAEVENFLDTPVKHFSSGMYMRLAFAVAAHLESEILIVDEVLAVGDIAFQKKCLGKMEDVSKRGRTILFVSHNMDAVIRLCSRCVLLSRGSVEADTSTKQVVTQYLANKKQQVAVLDLRTAQRSWEPRLNASFESVRMAHNNNRNAGWSLPYGEPIGFEIQIKVQESLAGLEIGMAISTAMGNQFSANLSSERLPLTKVEAGHYTYAIHFQNLRLIPGGYNALIWMRSEAGSEDFIYRAFEFDIAISESSAHDKTDTFEAILVPQAEHQFTRQSDKGTVKL